MMAASLASLSVTFARKGEESLSCGSGLLEEIFQEVSSVVRDPLLNHTLRFLKNACWDASEVRSHIPSFSEVPLGYLAMCSKTLGKLTE